MSTLRRHTTYTFELDDHVFSLPFDPEGEPEWYQISTDGTRAALAFLVPDNSPADPFEKFDEGIFYQFDRSRCHDCSRPDPDEFKRIIRANPGRVVTVCTRGEGFTVDAGPFTVADTKGDPSAACKAIDNADGYYIAPSDVTDAASYATSALSQYTAWCEGDVYGVIVWTYTRAGIDEPWGEPDRDQEVWGYYGCDYAREELRSAFATATEGY